MQFRPLRKVKIEFEKSNNAGQFAGKCASHPNAVGIVHRLDTMRPIGGPGFLQHSRLFFARSTPSPYTPVFLVRVRGSSQRPEAGQTTFFVSFSAFFFFFPFFLFLFSPPPFPRLGFSSWLAPKPSVIGRVARDLHRGVEKWPLISRSRFFSTEPRVEAGG